ncbi:hypothetical protein F5879DRAFT_961604 [Lentinula edodes]|uniref:Chromatin modification-related protein n=1 Tax=Lentinula edodes TaxID=5353 RepID=A0A1Q3EA10_LENED|nr:hypothetical protein F5879DRAFT_961604 [Lentinula edodes]KAJ3918155.1 hypothetical protein F5877DRAFT_43151 [Lentinula edodes]GAW04052.1 4 histone acetyltransferase complex component yng2 [Lentinula edodes]
MSVSAQSLEDAANIATEFIYSLDNIPNEIKHILEEITHKDSRTQELQHQIDSDSARWIRYSLRGASAGAGSSPSSLLSPSKPIGHLPAKIKQAYAEIEQLSTEKLALAERVVDLITRTYTRLGVDLNRSRVLQGELPTDTTRSRSVSAAPSLIGNVPAAYHATVITDGLKQALNSSWAAENRPAVVNTPASAPLPKKRKVTSSPSIKLPPSRSISPATPATKSASHTRSRLSRQTYPPPRHNKIEEPEEDEDDEPEAEGDDEDDDHKLYCFCQKPSAGDMIACDNNSGCPYEWFHLECVGITEPPPDTAKWYCPHCIDKVTARKGRKKSAS